MKLVPVSIILIILNATPFTLGQKHCYSSYNTVCLPVYSVWLLGVFIILLIIAIIYLLIVLKRNGQGYSIFKNSNVQEIAPRDKMSSRTLKTQTSQEMTMLNMKKSNSLQISSRGNESFPMDTITHPVTNKEIPKSNTVAKHSNLAQDFKIYRNQKISQNVILKDQMKMICDAALAKSKSSGLDGSLKDLNELIQNSKTEHENEDEIVEATKMSASYPHLDIYENPSNIPVPGSQSTDYVYDCLPSAKKANIVIQDTDTQYLLTLSPENSIRESDYVNIHSVYVNRMNQ